MAIYQRGDRFQANFMLDGNRVRAMLDTEEAAKAFEADCRTAHKLGKPLPSPQASPTRDIQWLVDECARLHWISRKSSVELTRNARLFADWTGPKAPVSRVLTPSSVDAYVSWRMETKQNSTSTINRHLSAISVLLKHAVRIGLVPNTFELPWQKEGHHRMRYFTEQEENAILLTLLGWDQEDYYCLFAFLADTGARLGEAQKLKWTDIRYRSITFEDTKNGTNRTVTATPRVERCLAMLLGKTYRHDAGPFTWVKRTRLRTMWDRLKGTYPWMEDAVIHTWRHTCASRLVQRGVDLYRVQRWMGHKNIATTMGYAHLAPKHLEELADVLASQ